jgi:hypothetical protein
MFVIQALDHDLNYYNKCAFSNKQKGRFEIALKGSKKRHFFPKGTFFLEVLFKSSRLKLKTA